MPIQAVTELTIAHTTVYANPTALLVFACAALWAIFLVFGFLFVALANILRRPQDGRKPCDRTLKHLSTYASRKPGKSILKKNGVNDNHTTRGPRRVRFVGVNVEIVVSP